MPASEGTPVRTAPRAARTVSTRGTRQRTTTRLRRDGAGLLLPTRDIPAETRLMQRLTGLDASFLYLETPTSHMHVASTAVYDPSGMTEKWDAQRVKEEIDRRLHLVPPFRRRLEEIPFQLHHPLWIEDPD